jgi:hypothetical protein
MRPGQDGAPTAVWPAAATLSLRVTAAMLSLWVTAGMLSLRVTAAMLSLRVTAAMLSLRVTAAMLSLCVTAGMLSLCVTAAMLSLCVTAGMLSLRHDGARGIRRGCRVTASGGSARAARRVVLKARQDRRVERSGRVEGVPDPREELAFGSGAG